MKLLSRIEEIILLAVIRLGAEAYGLTICREVSRVTEKDWLVGAIYAPLARLHKNGHIEIRPGAPGPETGESRRVYYQVTPQGREVLAETRRITARGWVGLAVPKPERP